MDPDPWDEDEPLLDGIESLPAGTWDAPPAATPGFHDALFARTAGVLRSRARRRRLAGLGAVILAYVAGAATVHLLSNRIRAGGPAPRPASPLEIVRAADDTPDDLVREALATPGTARAALFERAGDRFLAERGDIESALACYRRSLDAQPSDGGIAVDPGDNWLLIALKQARRQEKEGGRS